MKKTQAASQSVFVASNGEERGQERGWMRKVRRQDSEEVRGRRDREKSEEEEKEKEVRGEGR